MEIEAPLRTTGRDGRNTLIRQMSGANPLWGAPRIHGELLKLGIDVGQTSVAKYRQRIANFREHPIETNEYHSIDGAEGEFLWSSSPQNVDLLPQRPNLCLKHYPRPDQIHNHPTNEPAKIPHCTRSSSDSRSTAKQDKVCDRDRFHHRPVLGSFRTESSVALPPRRSGATHMLDTQNQGPQ